MNQQQEQWTKKQLEEIYQKVKGYEMTEYVAGYLIHSVRWMVDKSKNHPEVRAKAVEFLTELSIKAEKGIRL